MRLHSALEIVGGRLRGDFRFDLPTSDVGIRNSEGPAFSHQPWPLGGTCSRFLARQVGQPSLIWRVFF